MAYLITIRTFGTWLHGDERNSVDRHGKNVFGTKKVAPDRKLKDLMKDEMKGHPFIFSPDQEQVVKVAPIEVCKARNYLLQAVSVTSSHLHAVVTVQSKPERIADTLKAFATKRLRDEGLVSRKERVWSRGRSRRYLWKPRHVISAIDYVLYCQDDKPFFLDDDDAEARMQ